MRDYLGDKKFYIWCGLIALGLFLRWFDLETRPLHHDESIHAMFGKYFYDFPDHNYYKYNPEYHGPTLYIVLRYFYHSIGSLTDAAPRVPIVILGSLLLFAPILFRKYFKPWGFLFLTAFLALSPTLIYWSRFCREDFFVYTAMFLILWGATRASAERRALWIFLGIALNWGTKANVYVLIAQIIGYIVYEGIVLRSNESTFSRMLVWIRTYPKQLIMGFTFGALFYSYLITTEFRFLPGILDGLYRTSIPYWMDKHGIERISGPFNFHFYQLSWYELLFIIAFLVHFITFYLRGGLNRRLWGLGTVLIAALLYWYHKDTPVEEIAKWRFLKLKDRLDVIGAVVLFLHPLAVTTTHLLRNERVLGFTGYFFTANFFTYSYLGEKVPWLSTYILIPGIIYLVLYYQNLLPDLSKFEGRVLLRYFGWILVGLGAAFMVIDGESFQKVYFMTGFGLLAYSYLDKYVKFLPQIHLGYLGLVLISVFLLRMAILTNFVTQDREVGFISQVHTTKEFKRKILAARFLSESGAYGRQLKINVSGEPVWPGTWYLKDMPQYDFKELGSPEISNYDIILKTWKEGEAVPEGFVQEKINLRGWWVPDYSKMTLKNYLKMAISLHPWSGNGYSYTTVLTNKRLTEIR